MASRLGDTGVKRLVTILDQNGSVVDLSSATAINITLYSPSGAGSATYAATLDSDGTDGKMYLTTDSVTHHPYAGEYKIEGSATFPASGPFYSSTADFVVEKRGA